MTEGTEIEPVKPARLMSIDALRGFDMLWITGGAGVVVTLERLITGHNGWLSQQFQHVAWEGFRFEDLIMPLFMFLAGVSLPFSLASRLARNPSRLHVWGHTLKRFILLWLFGMAVQGNLLSWNLGEMKFFSNTLQTIAIGGVIATALHLYLSLRWQVVASAGMLLVTWALFAWVPAPGGVAGDYTPDGNLAIWLDRYLLGSHQDGTHYAWFLGSLNYGVTTMLGVFSGWLLRSKAVSGNGKALWLAGAGGAAMALGVAWTPLHPLIKHLWTGSFVLYAGGLSMLLMALFYWVIDVRGWRFGCGFFVTIGANAIAAYLMVDIWGMGMICDRVIDGLNQWIHGGAWDLLKAVAPVVTLWLILRLLYRHKIFLKV